MDTSYLFTEALKLHGAASVWHGGGWRAQQVRARGAM